MKRIILALLVGVFFQGSYSFAGCEELFQKIKTGLETDGTLVRVVTNYSGADNVVRISRGYLEIDENRPNTVVAESKVFLSKGPNGSDDTFFSPENTFNANIEFIRHDDGRVQLNYLPENRPEESVGYLADCHQDVIFIYESNAILTASFRFSQMQ